MVGGGDGGIVREVAKHSCVQEIHLCEIDQVVTPHTVYTCASTHTLSLMPNAFENTTQRFANVCLSMLKVAMAVQELHVPIETHTHSHSHTHTHTHSLTHTHRGWWN